MPIAETIRGFKEIIEGQHDDVPESAFFLKGTIDDVVKAASGKKDDYRGRAHRSRVEVLTPEGEVFDDEVELVSTRTEVGSIGILARHQPLLGLLEPTELRLYKSETDIVRYAQGEGYVQVSRRGRARPRRGGPRARATLDTADLREKLRQAEDELRGRRGGHRGAAPRGARQAPLGGVPARSPRASKAA